MMLLLAFVLGIVPLYLFPHAAPRQSFDQVQPGMSQVRVRELLGSPHSIRFDGQRTVFYYGGGTKWCTMEIFFGADGNTVSKFHDH
jgi:hypothetical protein